MAPVYLLPLIEIYCSPARENCPHVVEAQGSIRPIEELLALGLVEHKRDDEILDSVEDHGLRVTEAGRAYVEAVTSIELPLLSPTPVDPAAFGFEFYAAEVDRITDALELFASNLNASGMIRAREKCLELRAKVIKQQLEPNR